MTRTQEVKVNQADCMRLAWRATRLITEIGQRMEGKWDTAPPALMENVRKLSEYVYIPSGYLINLTILLV